MKALGLLAVLALAGGCRDQRAACTRALEAHRERDIERCVKEAWSDERIECELRAGGGFQAMFCAD